MPDRPTPPLLRPFAPGEFVQNADGSVSTERTITIDVDGGFINVPTLWKSPNGQTLDLSFNEDLVRQAAQRYQQAAGEPFALFQSVEDAVRAAQARSHQGGAFEGQMPAELGKFGGLGGLGGIR